MTVAVIALILGVAGLVISLIGVATQVLPRRFTPGQQRAITDWEIGSHWRTDTAGTIFPSSVSYTAPASLSDDRGLKLTATRIGIARQASCAAATDPPVAAVLARNGCEAVLRATYADGTDSYVVTVGVAAMPGSAQAAAAKRELPSPAKDLGVRPVRFKGTPAAAFTNLRRQIWGVLPGNTGTYVFFYTIGYADGRQQVLVTADSYGDAEMTSMGQGVAQAVGKVLAGPMKPPHCPGTPGC
jgi:hypothetical protein